MTGERFKARPPGEGVPRLDRTESTVDDLRRLGRDAEEIAAVGRQVFFAPTSSMFRHAADGLLIKVQELCERLPAAYREARPQIRWEAIRGLRNRLGHDYRTTDYEVVWQALTVSVPELIDSLDT